MSRIDIAWKKRKKSELFKTYHKGEFKELEDETRALSLLAARYEVLYLNCSNEVTVKVRCRKNSRVYQLCQQFGYYN